MIAWAGVERLVGRADAGDALGPSRPSALAVGHEPEWTYRAPNGAKGLDGGGDGQDAEHADQGDGGGIESLGDEAFTPFSCGTWIGSWSCLTPFKIQPGILVQQAIMLRKVPCNIFYGCPDSLLHCDIERQGLQFNEC